MASEKRLIDANERIQHIKDVYCNGCNHYNHVRCRACSYDDAIMALEDAPTVDAVEVVRCKDCKHYMEYPLNKVDKRMCCYVHILTPHFMPEDGFCSYGERKDNETL